MYSVTVYDRLNCLSVLPLSCVQTARLCSYYSTTAQCDGWQMPQAHIDFLLRYFTLSLSRLALWHQSILYSFMSVPFILTLLFPAFHLHVCLHVSSPRLDVTSLVSCLTLGQTWKSNRAHQWLIPTTCSLCVELTQSAAPLHNDT